MSYLPRLCGMVAAASALLALNASTARAELVFGLTTSNVLFSFDSANPGLILTSNTITGFAGDLIGIDFRPQNGLLYAVSTTNIIYTINPGTGVVASSIALFADPGDVTDPFVGISGDFYGFDFNPVADRLRMVSGNGQNLRINVDTGATFTDANLNGFVGTAEFAAYTNNVAGAVSTSLFVIDSNTDSLYTQSPANAGTTALVGALGADVLANGGFDISGATGIAYLGVNAAGEVDPSFHTVNLTTGQQTLIGTISVASGDDLKGLTIAPAAAAPEPGSVLLLGLGLVGGGIAVRARRRR